MLKLTTSLLPGTTIGMAKVEDKNLGIKLIDTPGIPNIDSVTFKLLTYADLASVNINKCIVPINLALRQGYSIWLGALVRLDMLNGTDKLATFHFSSNVTIHKTPMLFQREIFEKQAGKLLRPVATLNYNVAS